MKQRKRTLKTSVSGTGDSKALAHCQSAFCLVRRWTTSLKSKLEEKKKSLIGQIQLNKIQNKWVLVVDQTCCNTGQETNCPATQVNRFHHKCLQLSQTNVFHQDSSVFCLLGTGKQETGAAADPEYMHWIFFIFSPHVK